MGTKAPAFFSVIIPVYNTPKEYLDCCMASLAAQTMGEMEIILVDDGSAEPCRSLCDGYAAADERIRVIHQVNQGVSAARNNGIASAKADWILFVDADDWLEPDACMQLREELEYASCDILQFRAIKEYPGRQEKLHYGYEDGKTYDLSDTDIRERMYRRVMGVTVVNGVRLCTAYYSCDKVFRRAFLRDNGLEYPVGVPKSEDKVFILTCLEKLGAMRYTDKTLYHYRMNAGSAIHKYAEKADANCRGLAEILMPIAQRMDREIGLAKGEGGYDRISSDCERFLFGILSDVLFLKFYHRDCPLGAKARRTEALAFLNGEPFRTCIRRCPYGALSMESKLKKLLLCMNMPGLFCAIRRLYGKALGKSV